MYMYVCIHTQHTHNTHTHTHSLSLTHTHTHTHTSSIRSTPFWGARRPIKATMGVLGFCSSPSSYVWLDQCMRRRIHALAYTVPMYGSTSVWGGGYMHWHTQFLCMARPVSKDPMLRQRANRGKRDLRWVRLAFAPAYIYIYPYMYIYIYTSTYMYVCIYIHTHTLPIQYTHTHTHTHTHTVSTYNTHTHTHTNLRLCTHLLEHLLTHWLVRYVVGWVVRRRIHVSYEEEDTCWSICLHTDLFVILSAE
jgi:hypothetical protein